MPTSTPETAPSSQTVSGLLREFTTHLSTLLRQELTLARLELYQSLTHLLWSAGAFVGGIALFYAGFLLLLAAAVAGLSLVLPFWLAALILGVAIVAVAWSLVRRGQTILRDAHLTPARLPHSLRRDKDVLLRKVHP
jgi:hypothetical protein